MRFASGIHCDPTVLIGFGGYSHSSGIAVIAVAAAAAAAAWGDDVI